MDHMLHTWIKHPVRVGDIVGGTEVLHVQGRPHDAPRWASIALYARFDGHQQRWTHEERLAAAELDLGSGPP